ncbi:protein SOSEKI 5 [Elaeis guineensis]|uniref:Protein UPSTREAM OF FLC n=1 Tax=Elaeis guineensis var. tenera TaxID=51953 RepID=A0A6I9Q9X4_ELAGV|nr:protein UPSTREAM OF FLC [Elaeis guineensis]
MAASSRGRGELSKQWKKRETNPGITKVWSEPEPKPRTSRRKVSVVYYLARDGHFEHPHFMEVPLSSIEGLYLRDVIHRLDVLRGKGMAAMYSWSSKRSYKNGFVWHDLSEDDFIYPVHGQEYILKGSELPHLGNNPSNSQESLATSSSTYEKLPKIPNSVRDDSNFPVSRRKKTSWSSIDLNETPEYKSAPKPAPAVTFSDASIQTDDLRHRWRVPIREERREKIPNLEALDLDIDEISPPPSPSSPETLEALIKADGRIVAIRPDYRHRTVGDCSNGRVRASSVLMHLISCGSISVKETGISLVSQYRGRLPRVKTEQGTKEIEAGSGGMPTSIWATGLEDMEYFSGSLIETRKLGSDDVGEFPSLKRSSSYNAARSLRMELSKEIEDDHHARGMRRKSNTRKGGKFPITRSTCRSIRIND